MIEILKKSLLLIVALGFSLALLMNLCGCNASSDPRLYYQATGSWHGTINGETVRGAIAPDGNYHLAILDSGNQPVGEYFGKVTFIDQDNIGILTLQRLRPPESAGSQQTLKFKLSADRIYSTSGIELSRNNDATGPAALSDAALHWTFSGGDTGLTNVRVLSDGSLIGGDGANCSYTGALQLLSPSWKIYMFDLTVDKSDITKTCTNNNGSYSGLAMLLGEGENHKLWFSSNSLAASGAKTYIGEWLQTQNVAPVVKLNILGERADGKVLARYNVNKIADIPSAIELDAKGSSDVNGDPLSYTWSGTDPGGNPLTIIPNNTDGSLSSFVPTTEGAYSLTLSVSDGLLMATDTDRVFDVRWTKYRYWPVGNGTVLDTKTSLLWLRDAGCSALNIDLSGGWGVLAEDAKNRVETILADGACSLTDASQVGDWHLPTRAEFRNVVEKNLVIKTALTNSLGDGEWQQNDAFAHVGGIGVAIGENFNYWTNDPDGITNWWSVNFKYISPEQWVVSDDKDASYWSVWAVRPLRAGELPLPPD